MDLAQIGRGRVSRHTRAMLDGRTLMRITFDTEPGHQPDTGLVGFDQSVS
jgi:hypothetical protein